jgi:hypothetical protein
LLQENISQEIFRSGIGEVHYAVFSRSLQVMSLVLRRDVYGLRAPGIIIDQVKQPDPDPLAAIRYFCLYWVDHLLECQSTEDIIKDLKDSGQVYSFLRQHFLYWLEALSLLRSVPQGIVIIKKLEDLQVRIWIVLSLSDYPNVNKFNRSPNLSAFIHDARRFTVSTRSIIEQAPLQAYCSALVFAPEKSIVREAFESCIPPWIQKKPRVEIYWNAMLQTLEGILMRSAQSPSPLTASRSCLGLGTRPSGAGTQPRDSSYCQPSRAILIRSAQSPSPLTASRSCLGLGTRPSQPYTFLRTG